MTIPEIYNLAGIEPVKVTDEQVRFFLQRLMSDMIGRKKRDVAICENNFSNPESSDSDFTQLQMSLNEYETCAKALEIVSK